MTASVTAIVESMATAWNAGDMQRVLALAAQVSDAEVDTEAFLALLGVTQQQTGDYPRAAQTFERLTRMQPDVPAWWNNLGEACRQAGDLPVAERALSKARSLAPGDADVHYNLGLLYIQQQRWSLAREVLLDAARLAPGFVEARLEAACQRVRHTRRRKARLAYFAPAIVSAAGKAHCPATPASDSVRVSSVSCGTPRVAQRRANSACVFPPTGM